MGNWRGSARWFAGEFVFPDAFAGRQAILLRFRPGRVIA